MKLTTVLTTSLLALSASLTLAAGDDNPIKKSMDYTHKAPKGEKKISEKIVDGTASDEEVKRTLELYKAMVDCKPPKGDQAAFKEKVVKLISATEDVIAKKPDAAAGYKTAANCKACHSDHKEDKK